MFSKDILLMQRMGSGDYIECCNMIQGIADRLQQFQKKSQTLPCGGTARGRLRSLNIKCKMKLLVSMWS